MTAPARVTWSARLAASLTVWLPTQRWFAGKGRPLRHVGVEHCLPFREARPQGGPEGVIVVARAHFADGGPPEDYQVPLGVSSRLPAAAGAPAVVARDRDTVVYDALADPELTSCLVGLIARGTRTDGLRFRAESPGMRPPHPVPSSRPLGVEQSNSSVVVDGRYLLKVFRRLGPGRNPDLELHRMLHVAGSAHVPRLLGSIEGPAADGPTYATLQEYAEDAPSGWDLALRDLRRLPLLGGAAAPAGGAGGSGGRTDGAGATGGTRGGTADVGTAASAAEAASTAEAAGVGEAWRLGEAVAAVHRELAAVGGSRPLGRSGLARLAGAMTNRFDLALEAVPRLAPYEKALREAFAAVAGMEPEAAGRAQRVHGDLHLGQVLRAPDGWLLIDFEGEPARPLTERRAMASPVRDVAGMLRSFSYAAHHALGAADRVPGPAGAVAEAWARRMQGAFCDGYAAASRVDPRSRARAPLLAAYQLDKAVYEVLYETRNRPDWAWNPLRAIGRLLNTDSGQ
jgi:maltokinase